MDNVTPQGLCPADFSGHAAVGPADAAAFHEVANALDPGNATPTACES